ncbi:hypothetical protein [Paenibacillus sp. sgz302251]|uniref:hypothetical protein n=1 Tax=Paenibacillus sp. sgz302251 TaxID=3414493 RepID=UPI003C7A9FA0
MLGYTLIGNAVQKLLSLPLSGNVIGLMLLVLSLFAGWLAVSAVLVGATLIVLFVTGKLSSWQAVRKKERSNE